jgi:cytochrome P450
MDLVLDYASPVPAILTMRLMGLPYDNWQLYANLFHGVMDAAGADQYNKVIAEVPAMVDGLLKFAAVRRADPADDLTSFLVQFEFDGERLDDNQLIDILWNLIGGGVDTTTSLTSLSLLHLGTPSRSARAAHRPTRALPHRGGRVSALLLGQQDAEPHGESRHRPWRPTASAQRPGAH